jgi:hypothetical protein
MYGIYANIWGILMGSMLPYIAYMDPMGISTIYQPENSTQPWQVGCPKVPGANCDPPWQHNGHMLLKSHKICVG